MHSSTENSANGSSSPRRKGAWRPALAALPLASVILFLSGVIPPPHCLVHATAGLYCPSCGTWTAFRNLLLGDFGGALAANPIFPYWFFLYGLLFLQASLSLGGFAWSPGRDYLRCVSRNRSLVYLHAAAFAVIAAYENLAR